MAVQIIPYPRTLPGNPIGESHFSRIYLLYAMSWHTATNAVAYLQGRFLIYTPTLRSIAYAATLFSQSAQSALILFGPRPRFSCLCSSHPMDTRNHGIEPHAWKRLHHVWNTNRMGIMAAQTAFVKEHLYTQTAQTGMKAWN